MELQFTELGGGGGGALNSEQLGNSKHYTTNRVEKFQVKTLTKVLTLISLDTPVLYEHY